MRISMAPSLPKTEARASRGSSDQSLADAASGAGGMSPVVGASIPLPHLVKQQTTMQINIIHTQTNYTMLQYFYGR
jgi:hypothetical protein